MNGGFWNPPKVQYSEQTKSILKDLMRESNVANSYRQKINSQLSKGESLDSSLKNDTVLTNKRINKRSTTKKAPRFYRPGLRPQHVILSKLNEEPPYRPPPVPQNAGAAEKTRLAHLMAYGEDPRSKATDPKRMENGRFAFLRRRLQGTRKLGQHGTDEDDDPCTREDRFTELIREVKERRQFLDQMRVMGKEDLYKSKVETEISQLVREMELIDMKRSAELQRAIENRQ